MEGLESEAIHVVSSSIAKEPSWVKWAPLGRYINCTISSQAELPPQLSSCFGNLVQTYVVELLKKTAQRDARFRGKLIPAGSFFDGTKVTAPDEFDFIFELSSFPSAAICPEHMIPPSLRPATEVEPPQRGYYKLNITSGQVMYEKLTKAEELYVLDPDTLHRDFFECMRRIVKENNPQSESNDNLLVKDLVRNGPAVCITLAANEKPLRRSLKERKGNVTQQALKQMRKWGFKNSITVDLVPAISVRLSQLRLRESGIETVLGDDSEKMHLVPSGNYWKLSVAKQESRLIRSLTGVSWLPMENAITCDNLIYSDDSPECNSNNEIYCHTSTACTIGTEAYQVREVTSYRTQSAECRRSSLLAMKHIRGKISSDLTKTSSKPLQQKSKKMKDIMGKVSLPTYPLKVAFLQECHQHPSDADWTEAQLGRRVYNMLDKTEKHSQDATLKGYFMTNVPVLKNPNYNISMQARLMKRKLMEAMIVYFTFSTFTMISCVAGLCTVVLSVYTSVTWAIFFCCTDKGWNIFNTTGQKCVFFNVSCDCSDILVVDKDVWSLHDPDLTLIFRWLCALAYISVFLFRVVGSIHKMPKECHLVCNPFLIQLIPQVTSVLYIAVFFLDVRKTEIADVIITASFESVYFCYETTCLFSFCLLCKQKQPLSDCIGPWKTCTIAPQLSKPYVDYT